MAPDLFGPAPEIATQRMVEAILFASAAPLSEREIADRLPRGAAVGPAIQALTARYAGGGVVLERIGKSYAFRTAPDLGFLMRRDVVVERPLSRAAMETLAIIAYHQPVTRTEIEEVRGVGVSKGTLDLLLEIGWIRVGRRRETPGRPATFVTTPAFLDHFALEDVRDLPALAELRRAGLMDPTPPEGAAAPAERDDGLFGERDDPAPGEDDPSEEGA